MAISHCYWHLVVNNGNFTLLLDIYTRSKWQFHSTLNLADEPTLAARTPGISEQTWLDIPVHKTWQMNLLWLLEPLVQEQRCLEYQYKKLGRWTYVRWWTPNVAEQRCLHTATDISWSRMAISHCYWYLVVKNGNFTLLLTSSGQEWQFHIATDI